MSIPTTFALSLELSRLVPLNLLANEAVKAIMSLARDLQNSGSDIVIEEDLAGLLGRAQISHQFASTFKAATARSATAKLCDGLILQSGPGPTVIRAFQHTAYFSMVVQCSLLASCHQISSLAGVFVEIFEKQAEGTPPEVLVRASPTREGIYGVLQACQDQTADFRWTGLIQAVSSTLVSKTGRRADNAWGVPLPPAVIHGAIYAFPLVQSLPEDRYVLVQCSKGVAILVVWAHHVLGLTVLVKAWHSPTEGFIETRFGTGLDQVVIKDRPGNGMNSVTLMQSADQEVLFSFKPDPNDAEISGSRFHPIRGLAKQILCSIHVHPSVRREACMLSAGFAYHLASRLTVPQDESEYSSLGMCHYELDKEALLQTLRILHDEPMLSAQEIMKYERTYFRSSTLLDLPCPESISELLYPEGAEKDGWIIHRKYKWKDVVICAHHCAVIALAFAHVQELEDSQGALFSIETATIAGSHLDCNVREYDKSEGSTVEIGTNVFLSVLTKLMRGPDTWIGDVGTVDALSCNGWTIFRNTFGHADPYYVRPFGLVIRRGVPCRNGIYRHVIAAGHIHGVKRSMWHVEKHSAEEATMECKPPVRFGKSLIGDRSSDFVVNIRLELARGIDRRCRTSTYEEFQNALSTSSRTVGCCHSLRTETETLILPAGVLTVSGFCEISPQVFEGRVWLLLTANSTAARWQALIAVAHIGKQPVLIRGNDCCFSCTIQQALARNERCFVIL